MCGNKKEPLIGNYADTALLTTTDYEQLRAELEFLRMLAEAEVDVRTGRVTPIDDTFNDLRESLLSRRSR